MNSEGQSKRASERRWHLKALRNEELARLRQGRVFHQKEVQEQNFKV